MLKEILEFSWYFEWCNKIYHLLQSTTGSFFHDKSITLGSLIGISNILELSRRSARGRLPEPVIRNKKNYKSRTWLLSLCSRQNTDAVSMNTSLGHFLETERRAAATNYRRPNPSPLAYGADDFSHDSDSNPLFDRGRVAPPQSGSWADERTLSRDLLSHASNEDGTPLLLSCLCGNWSYTRIAKPSFIHIIVSCFGCDIWNYPSLLHTIVMSISFLFSGFFFYTSMFYFGNKNHAKLHPSTKMGKYLQPK